MLIIECTKVIFRRQNQILIINVSSFFLVVLIVDRGPVTNTTEFFTCNAGSSKWLVRQPTHSDL